MGRGGEQRYSREDSNSARNINGAGGTENIPQHVYADSKSEMMMRHDGCGVFAG